MRDAPDGTSFGYRSARHPFTKMVNIEVPQGLSSCVIGTHLNDISVDGAAVAADASFDPTEPVTLVIPFADGSALGFLVEFSANQRIIARRIRRSVARFAAVVQSDTTEVACFHTDGGNLNPSGEK